MHLWNSKVLLRSGCVLLMLLLLSDLGMAQSQQQLERRRRELSERIATTSRLLQSSSQNRKAALDRLVGLQRQIVQRQELIVLVQKEIAHADSSERRTLLVMQSMENDLLRLREEYGRMLRAALRQNLFDSRLGFILSAGSLDEAFRRALYLRRYDSNRRRQLELIAATRKALAAKVNKLQDWRLAKAELLEAELEQQGLLQSEMSDKNQLIRQLEGEESKLRSDMEQQLFDQQQLDEAIASIIAEAARKRQREEAARKEREAAARSSASAKTKRSNTEASSGKTMSDAPSYSATLSREFSSNKGKLPWPVEKGFISKPFGRQAHPTIAKVQINNNGVDIRTEPGAKAKSVFDGTVVGIQSVPGYHFMIVVQHGDFYTVYSNLNDVYVSQGQQVGTLETLGTLAIDPETQASDLHFEVWQQKSTQNPGTWIRNLR